MRHLTAFSVVSSLDEGRPSPFPDAYACVRMSSEGSIHSYKRTGSLVVCGEIIRAQRRLPSSLGADHTRRPALRSFRGNPLLLLRGASSPTPSVPGVSTR